MAKRASVSAKETSPLETANLKQCADEWFVFCDYQQFSPRTLEARRMFMRNLFWFLDHRSYTHCDKRELQQFFHYLRTGHEETGGRWGQPKLTKPLRPISVKDYHIGLQQFFKWAVKEGILSASPLDGMEPIRVREETKQPLSPDQVNLLVQAAKVSRNRHRDEAILLMLFDSGVRASELISLKVKDVDVKTGTFQVLGKGNKVRSCYLGKASVKALMVHLRHAKLPPDAPLFPSASGMKVGNHLTTSGLLTLIKRLAKPTGISVNVHQLRRTFATTILQGGADIVAVRDMLGHSNIQMTLKYLSVAKSHIEAQHRQFSPADNLKPK